MSLYLKDERKERGMRLGKELEFGQITTRGGDRGETSLYNGERRRKDDLLFETLGDLDELTSSLGVVKAGLRQFSPLKKGDQRQNQWLDVLEQIQKDLIQLGGMVANPDNRSTLKGGGITEKTVTKLEKYQKKLMESTTFPREFIHPGETLVSAWIDVARTVCRRCERRVVRCIRDGVLTHLIPCQVYLNRLSDYLFVSGRYWEQADPDLL